MKRRKPIILILITLFVMNCSLFGQGEKAEKKQFKYNNEFFVFLGGTSYVDHQGDYFSAGIDYARRLSTHTGVGVWGEAIFAEHTEWTFGVPFYYFNHHFFVRVAPGFEILQEAKDEAHPHETESVTAFLFRAGAGYAFHWGDMVIAPSFDVDWVRTTVAAVYGVNVGYAF